MVTPVQQMLKEYGLDMQIKFMDYNTMIKNVNARKFNVCLLAYSGLIYPNPEGSLRSELADQNDNNNVWGFKSDRVDELLDEYDICFDQKRRIEIIQEIDGLFSDAHPIAFSIARNYSRMMWWDKFGYPEWMLSRYVGEFWDAFYYWWIDDAKEKTLELAMEQENKLPLLPIDMKYWPKYLLENK
jgi:microcin C transport system substrate-binding protein